MPLRRPSSLEGLPALGQSLAESAPTAQQRTVVGIRRYGLREQRGAIPPSRGEAHKIVVIPVSSPEGFRQMKKENDVYRKRINR